MNAGMYWGVVTVANNLTDDELASINLCAVLDSDPKNAKGYDKAKDLFTEDNGMRMHDLTKEVLSSIVAERFSIE